MSSMVPVYEQEFYRIRDDTLSADTGTPNWITTENQSTREVIDVDTTFRVRFVIANTGTANGSPDLNLYYSHEGAAYAAVTAHTPIRSAIASTSSDNELLDSANFRLSAGTGITRFGHYDEDGVILGQTLNDGEYTEVEFGLSIDFSQVADGDTIDLRVYADGAEFDVYDTNTTALIEVNEAVDATPGTRFVFQEGTENSGLSASASTGTIGAPSEGELVVVYVGIDTDGVAITADAGGTTFTKAIDETVVGETCRHAMWWKIAGASEPTSYTFDLSTPDKWWTCLTYVFSTVGSDAVVDAAANTHVQTGTGFRRLLCGAYDSQVIANDALSIIFGGQDRRNTVDGGVFTDANRSHIGVIGDANVNQIAAGAYRIYSATGGETPTGDVIIGAAGNNGISPTYSIHISFVEGGVAPTLKTVTGSLTPTGAILKEAQVTVEGSATPTGALIKKAFTSIAGALTPTGALIKKTFLSFVGALTPTGAVATSKVVMQALAGALAPAGALIKETQKSLTGALTPTGALIKKVFTSIAGALTPTGALFKKALKVLAGALTPIGVAAGEIQVGATEYLKTVVGSLAPAGALIKETQKSLTGSVASAGALVKKMITSFVGALTPTGSITKETQVTVEGGATPTGALQQTIVFLRSVVGVLTPTGGIIKKTLKAIAGALTPTATITKDTLKNVSGSVAPTSDMTKDTSKDVDGSVTPTGATAAALLLKTTVTGVITVIAGTVSTIYTPVGAVATRAARRLLGMLRTLGGHFKRR